jgi:hypothetical protein
MIRIFQFELLINDFIGLSALMKRGPGRKTPNDRFNSGMQFFTQDAEMFTRAKEK